MASLYTNRPTENESEEAALRFLQEQLPDEYVVVGNVALTDSDRVPEIDVVVIKDTAVFTLEVKGWRGPIKGNLAAGEILVGDDEQPQRNPLHQAERQAKQLASYLRQPEQSRCVFGDPRIGASLYVIPLVIFTHPEADMQIESTARVKALRLADVPAVISDPALRGRSCFLNMRERRRMARLLLNELSAQPATAVKPAEPVAPPTAVVPTITEDPPTSLAERPRIIHQPLPDETEPLVAAPPAEENKASRRPLLAGLVNWMADLPGRAEEKAEQFEDRLAGQKRGVISNAQLARAAERQLEQTLNHLLRGTVAHNHFLVGLAPADFEQYLPLCERVEAELIQYLQQVVESRDYDLEGALSVELVEMAPLLPGSCEVRSFIRKTAVTRHGAPYLELAGSGKRFPLHKAVSTIGRSRDNDICTGEIDRQNVISRLHAEIRQEAGAYMLYDRGSSRGTFLNGQKLNGQGAPLQDGDRFILGPTQKVDGKRPLQGSLMFIFRQG